jgi:4a-hydroxytetrahydrobiopterin dehydratase
MLSGPVRAALVLVNAAARCCLRAEKSEGRMMEKLNSNQIDALSKDLPDWQLDPLQGRITREFLLADFMQAFAFMTQIAIAAEKRNHHPEWSNVYNRVCITWTTHDVLGLSTNDIAMAGLCDQAFAGYQP